MNRMNTYIVRYSKLSILVDNPEIIEEEKSKEELISMLQKGGAVMWSAKLISELTKECSHADNKTNVE